MNTDKLTLEQLAPYLPFNPEIQILNHDRDYTGIKESTINGYYFIGESLHVTYKGGNTGKSVNEFKLILYPISCLTKEITHNGETFVPKEKLREISGAIEPDEDFKNTFDIKISEGKVIGFSAICMHVDQYALFQKLSEWHINFNGIPEGLYINKSTLKSKL